MKGKKRVLTPEDEQLAITLAGVLSKEQVADRLMMGRTTFYERLRDENSDFGERYEKARAIAVQKIANVLYSRALDGDFKAMNLYLKCRADWRETTKVESDIAVTAHRPKTISEFFDMAVGCEHCSEGTQGTQRTHKVDDFFDSDDDYNDKE